MPRPQLVPGAGDIGAISVVPYVVDGGKSRPARPGETLPVVRYRCRTRMRTIDTSKRDPVTGAFRAGPRVDVYAWTKTSSPKAVASAVQKAAVDRLQRDMTRQKDEAEASLPKVSTVYEKTVEVLGALVGGKDLAQSTLYVYRNHADTRLKPSVLGQMCLSDVTANDVDAHLTAMVKTIGVGSARLSRTVLRRTFRAAEREGVIEVSPVRPSALVAKSAPPRSRRVPQRSRALTVPEIHKLVWALCRSEKAAHYDLKDPVLLNMSLGLRIGEVFAIRWCDVSFSLEAKASNARAHVSVTGSIGREIGAGRGTERGDLKTTSSNRRLPCPKRVAALLRRRARRQGVSLAPADLAVNMAPVFPTPGRWERPEDRLQLRDKGNATHKIREIFDDAGFPWLSMHGLRRTVITTIADARPIRVAADFAGHSSIRTTQESYVARGSVADDVADLL